MYLFLYVNDFNTALVCSCSWAIISIVLKKKQEHCETAASIKIARLFLKLKNAIICSRNFAEVFLRIQLYHWRFFIKHSWLISFRQEENNYSVTTLTKATWRNFLQIKRLNIVEVYNKFPTNDYNSVTL